MARLLEGVGENSPQEYDRVYLKRKEKGIDVFDIKRWNRLLKHFEGGKLLDVGCLDSLVTSYAKEKYPVSEVWGIDVAKGAIDDMQERFPKIIFQVQDAYSTRFPPNYFDYIVAGEILEHMDSPEKFITEMFRILKKGGVLAISTPWEEEREVGAVDLHRHIWSFSFEDVDSLLVPHGDVWMRKLGSQFFPYYIYHWPVILAFCRKK